jgi:hypothetical protein
MTVDVGGSTGLEVVSVGTSSTVQTVQLSSGSGTGGATKLDDLTDVEGADLATPGQVLAKTSDGMWSPATISGEGPPTVLSYRHEQVAPATVWLITHPLPFEPAGVEVFDHLGARHFPPMSYPAVGQVRLDFNTPIRGTARLS